MYEGYLCFPCLDEGDFVERWTVFEDRDAWMDALYRSATLASRYLRDRVIGRTTAVLAGDEGALVVREIGHNARRYVDEWHRAVTSGASDADLQACERRLRHSARYWSEIFPAEQEDLTFERFVRHHADHHPGSYKMLYAKFGNAVTDEVPARSLCVFCGTFDRFSSKESKILETRGQPPPPPIFDACDACRDSRLLWRHAQDHLARCLPEIR
jgi:hypothetical protein